MHPKTFRYDRLVKSEDLNHHRTLFAGRCAEWFVEAGFIAIASMLPASSIVCLKIHGLSFTQPLKSGDIACFESKVVYTGNSSLRVYVTLHNNNKEDLIVEGFITFVHVNDDGHAQPHGIKLELSDPHDIELNQRAAELR
ncbi:MAG: acyl-CoA thioesterase [Anaerolineales bacterium]|nr:acyl-CoA thioesterase [Anaerolineales bacterium]